MARTVTATLEQVINFLFKDDGDEAGDIGVLEDKKRYRDTEAYTNGSSGGQINEMFRARRTVSAATGTDDLDLAGGLTNVAGETITFSEVKDFVIINRSTTAGDNLLVGGAGAGNNAWAPPWNGNQDAEDTVGAGGFMRKSSPIDGFAVTPNSQDVLRVTYSGTSGSIDYDIFIFGVKAS